MDLFTDKLDAFLDKKTEVIKEFMKENEKEKSGFKTIVQDTGLTYDMQKFLKTVREFEADRAKKSKKRVKDIPDM